MHRARSFFGVAVFVGCFGFGSQAFALGESCTATAYPGKSGVCADYDDQATYDVRSAGCTGIAFNNMSCAADGSVSLMVCAVECSVAYPAGGGAPGAGWAWPSGGSPSGSGGTPSVAGVGGSPSPGGGAGAGGTPPFTGVGGSPSPGGGGPVSCPAGTSLDGGTCVPTGVGLSTGSVSTSFGSVFSFPAICFSGPVLCVLATFLSWILTVLGIVTVISFVIAGLQYMLSLGDPKSVETAKAHMKWSVVGLIVALSGVIAILQINSWLGA